MKLHHSFGPAALSLVVTACGLGDGADIGESANQPIGSTGGSENGGSAGATENTGGAKQSSGGSEQSSGGATQASGGRSQGTGGAKQNTGGASQGAGGAVQGTGGGKPSTGGSTGTVTCGSNTCPAGQYCCNASCGMCAPMGAACIQIACVPPPDAGTCVQNVACVKGTSWSPTECKCVPESGGTCTTVADCQLVSDYCGGCNCLALSKGQKAPPCSGQMVQCLIDPCGIKTAACVNGRCVAN
jgi:hypothetical protein